MGILQSEKVDAKQKLKSTECMVEQLKGHGLKHLPLAELKRLREGMEEGQEKVAKRIRKSLRELEEDRPKAQEDMPTSEHDSEQLEAEQAHQ